MTDQAGDSFQDGQMVEQLTIQQNLCQDTLKDHVTFKWNKGAEEWEIGKIKCVDKDTKLIKMNVKEWRMLRHFI